VDQPETTKKPPSAFLHQCHTHPPDSLTQRNPPLYDYRGRPYAGDLCLPVLFAFALALSTVVALAQSNPFKGATVARFDLFGTVHCYDPFYFTHQGATWPGPDTATTGLIFPGPPATPLAPAAGVSDWVTNWIADYNTLPADGSPSSPVNPLYSPCIQ